MGARFATLGLVIYLLWGTHVLEASPRPKEPPLFAAHSRSLLLKKPIHLTGSLGFGSSPKRDLTLAAKYFSVGVTERDISAGETKGQYRWFHSGMASQWGQRLWLGAYTRRLSVETSLEGRTKERGLSRGSYGGSFEPIKDDVWRFGLWLMWRGEAWQVSVRREGLRSYNSFLDPSLGPSGTTIGLRRHWHNSIVGLSYSVPDHLLAKDTLSGFQGNSSLREANPTPASPWGELALKFKYVLNPRMLLLSSYAVSQKRYTVGGSWLWQGLELSYAYAVGQKLQQSHNLSVTYTWNSSYQFTNPKKRQKKDNKGRWQGYGRIPCVHAGCKTLRYFYYTRCSPRQDKMDSRCSKGRFDAKRKYSKKKYSRRANKKRPVLSLTRLVKAGMATARAYRVFQLWSRGISMKKISKKLALTPRERGILRRFRR